MDVGTIFGDQYIRRSNNEDIVRLLQMMYLVAIFIIYSMNLKSEKLLIIEIEGSKFLGNLKFSWI